MTKELELENQINTLLAQLGSQLNALPSSRSNLKLCDQVALEMIKELARENEQLKGMLLLEQTSNAYLKKALNIKNAITID